MPIEIGVPALPGAGPNCCVVKPTDRSFLLVFEKALALNLNPPEPQIVEPFWIGG